MISRNLYYMLYKISKHFPSSDSKVRFKAKEIRGFLVRKFVKSADKNINIDKGCDIPFDLVIGHNSGIGMYSKIGSKVTIGSNVMIAPECYIYTQNHNFNRLDIPMCEQGISKAKPVIIGDDVWIGIRVTILSGVKIGQGAVIGAGSIVTKNVEPYSIVAGNPARIVKFRK